MERRSFLGSLGALLAAPLALLSKRKPAPPPVEEKPHPSEFTYNGVQFVTVLTRAFSCKPSYRADCTFETAMWLAVKGVVRLAPGQSADEARAALTAHGGGLRYRHRGSDPILGREVVPESALIEDVAEGVILVDWSGRFLAGG